MVELKNSVALVTGGVQGIGKAIVQFLLEKGAKVVFCDINESVGKSVEESLNKEFDQGQAIFMKCDVSKTDELYHVFEKTKESFGTLDIVCNNAGIGTSDVKLARKVVEINLIAVIEGTYKAIEMMTTKNGHKGGIIVNMASAAGLSISHNSSYCSSKFGAVAFTRSLASMKDEGVRINCICPSYVDTEIMKVALKEKQTQEFLNHFGYAEMVDVVKAFERCLNEDEMCGKAIAVLPKGVIEEVKFQDPLMPLLSKCK